MRTNVVIDDELMAQAMKYTGLKTKRRDALLQFPIFTLGGMEIALKSAANFRLLRRRGITVRKTVDCLIATFAIENGFWLLHDDRDFDPFEKHLGLKVVR
ncbi:MAG: type II toxin-antitoxin system VapB family antitoxin [Chloroflexi bacterium]|nr:type II toxin-antitoxin system VapB family antitoxin [Chloroflexota bacterium]